MFRVALLLALLMPWQSFAMQGAVCATTANLSAHAATHSHCAAHTPAGAGEHRACAHCDLCGGVTASEPLDTRLTLPRSGGVALAALPARPAPRPPLDRLDRPPR